MSVMPIEDKRTEPDFNLLSWRHEGGPTAEDYLVTVVFPRRKHRPDCYFASGRSKYLVSPGAIDMGGLIITPRAEDFERITPRIAQNILREVTLNDADIANIAKNCMVENVKQLHAMKPKPN